MFVIAMRRMVLAAVILGLMIGAARPTKANYVLNGGFETGDFTDWTQAGDRYTSTTDEAHSGNFAGKFGAVGSLTFLSPSQDLRTTAGQRYVLSFWLRNLGEPANEFTVSVGGKTLLDQLDLQLFPYTQYTFSFTATAPTTKLTFGFRNDPSYFELDNVDVEGVPELDLGSTAGALTLLSGGVLVLTDRRRGRAVA